MPAILGSSPALPQLLNIVRPVMPALTEFQAEFSECLSNGQVTNNSKWVVEFERQLQRYLDVEHVLAFCNGETALICMLAAAQLRGDVIVPSYTFSGTAHAVIWAGLRPVFADIDPATFTLDPEDVARRITPETSAILAAPVYGNPCANDALASLAKERRLTLLFDSASGFGSTFDGRKLGAFGRAEMFSFHATKVFGTMEGGAIATNDGALYERARQLRSFGQVGAVDCALAGLNGKMMEVAALMGIRSLQTYDDVLRHRQRIADEYDRLLGSIPGLTVQHVTRNATSTRLYQAVRLDSSFGLSRDELVQALLAENIVARKFLDPPIHQMTYYVEQYGSQTLPRTEEVASSAVALPLPSDMTLLEVSSIGDALAALCREAPAVRAAINAVVQH